MLAGVRAEIDRGDRALVHREHRRLDRRRVAGHREHRSVVRRVRRIVEQADARHGADGGGDRLDDFGPPPLADVGNALDDWHGKHV